MVDKIKQELEEEHGVQVQDHVAADEEIHCGYCGKSFQGHESRIEKNIYGIKWVFCNEECLESFKDKSDYKDDDPDMTIEKEDTGFEINMSFTGPEHHDE